MKYCKNCHSYHGDNENVCPQCGADLLQVVQTPPPLDRNNAFDAAGPEGKSRGVCALLAILLGTLGVQYFYLGKVRGGVLTILLSLVTCSLWQFVTIIQGILMFCMSNEEFERKFVLSPSSLPLF